MVDKKTEEEAPWYAPRGRPKASVGLEPNEIATAQRKAVAARSAASTAAKTSGGSGGRGGTATTATAKPSATKAATTKPKTLAEVDANRGGYPSRGPRDEGATAQRQAVTAMSTGKPFTATKTPGKGTYRFKSAISTNTPGGGGGGSGGGRKQSAVATPKRVTASKATVAASPRRAMSDRVGAAGYTTSASSSADPGFTFGSKSSAAPKVAAAKKTKIGASHNVQRKSLFRNRKD